MAEIAVVDDEELIRELVSTSLTRQGHKVTQKREASQLLNGFEPGTYDLVISDYKMPGMNGIELAEKLVTLEPGIPIILMTAYGTVESAVQAMKLGVQDFVEKPFQVEMLEHTVSQVLKLNGLQKENSALKKTLLENHRYVGESPAVQQLIETVDEIAGSHSTVLITGESGTGKELIAQAIHYKSPRRGLPFVKINCAAIPESLIESELFGHEKGSYTGAVKSRPGKFELADGGTLLLDEIGEMPLYAQSKLLRVLQEREVTKIGGSDEIRVDVRIICTTNRDLQEEVAAGHFREDLFYRLNVIPISLPPLRQRMDDLPALCEHFIRKYNAENGYHVEGIEQGAMSTLRSHGWPGNVRELENVMQRAVVFAKSDWIAVSHLKMNTSSTKQNLENDLNPGMSVAEAERILILKTLEKCDDNRTRAAEMLDISIRTLRNKLNEYKTGQL